MKLPSAFQLLRALTEIELNQLAHYLADAFFVPDRAHARVLKYWRTKRGEQIDKEELFQIAYPNKPFLNRDWHLLMSRFQGQVEKFLIWQELQKDDFSAIPLLLRNLRRRKLTSFFQRTIRKARNLREKRQRNEASMLYMDYDFELAYYDFISSPNRRELTNLQEVSDKLDHFYIAEKLKQACLAHSRKLANEEDYKIGLLKEILNRVEEQPDLKEVPAIAVYYACFQAVVLQKGQLAFQQLRAVMEQYQKGFPKQEVRDIYLLAINYCIGATNRGEEAFIAEAFELYRLSLERGYLVEDGQIPESAFNNIVSIGLRLKEFSWVSSFIDEYAARLNKTFQEPVAGLNRAKLAYEQGHLEKSMRLLVQIETKAPFIYLGVKTLQLKVFYELGMEDALDNLLESLRIYLQRRKDLGYRKQHYLYLLKFTRRLMQLDKADQVAVKNLRTAILASEVFQEKKWFLTQF